MTEEKRGKLEYAHRFAIEQLRDESRGFWAKVAALLTLNSLLIAGFAFLYNYISPISPGSENNINGVRMLSAIAASGIAIQTMWLFFGTQSFAHFKALGKLLSEIEEEIQKCDTYIIPQVIPHVIPQASKPWFYFGKYREEFTFFRENYIAAGAIFLFFGIFLAIWLYALALLHHFDFVYLTIPIVCIGISVVHSLLVLSKIYKAWKKFYRHLGLYIAINIGLGLIWAFASGGGYPWFAWPLGIWGIIVGCHFLRKRGEENKKKAKLA